MRAGDAIVSWDPEYVEDSGRSAMCAVVVLDCPYPATALSDNGAEVGSSAKPPPAAAASIASRTCRRTSSGVDDYGDDQGGAAELLVRPPSDVAGQQLFELMGVADPF